MKKSKLPKTDSVAELAQFWDTHDVTDFEDELEEVSGPVFVRGKTIKVRLPVHEAAAIKKLARAKGVSDEALVRSWVRLHLGRSNGRDAKKRGPVKDRK